MAGPSLWAWVTEESGGRISMVGALIGEHHTPLCHRDRNIIEKLRPVAKQHAEATGQRVWLREYTAAIEHGEA